MGVFAYFRERLSLEVISIDFAKLPIGSAMALAQNDIALQKFGTMTQQEKQAYIQKAHNAQSEQEMTQMEICTVVLDAAL